MKIHYLQDIKVKNYALVAKLWKTDNLWFKLSGVISNRKDGKEVFDRVVFRPGDRMYLAKNNNPKSVRSPKYLLYVKKT